MWRFILFILLGFIFYHVLRFLVKYAPVLTRKTETDPEPEELVQDPYCQTYVPKTSAVKKRISGKDFYFCNSECLRKYVEKSKR